VTQDPQNPKPNVVSGPGGPAVTGSVSTNLGNVNPVVVNVPNQTAPGIALQISESLAISMWRSVPARQSIRCLATSVES